MNKGTLVDVNGTQLNVYTEGSGDVTAVIMSGGGVTAPVLEYKPIYRRLSAKLRVAVVEKAGYGLSGGMRSPRTVGNLVAEDREALRAAGIEPPYVLVPHSYSGFEAIYWANTYPDEVRAVLSMDMAIPELAVQQSEVLTEEKRLKQIDKQTKLLKAIAKDGFLARLFRNKAENVSGLLTGSELTGEEKAEYRRLFYKNLANEEYAEESRQMTANAKAALGTGTLRCPACFYISDMKMLSKKLSWRQSALGYAKKCGGEVHLSDKGHMMYALIPDEMAQTFIGFLEKHGLA
ncbi:MAG: alpha/beta hydrolase [Ruminococcus sp.]|nr:alpha/beta hydrolase [Ruminococcus sp.]